MSADSASLPCVLLSPVTSQNLFNLSFSNCAVSLQVWGKMVRIVWNCTLNCFGNWVMSVRINSLWLAVLKQRCWVFVLGSAQCLGWTGPGVCWMLSTSLAAQNNFFKVIIISLGSAVCVIRHCKVSKLKSSSVPQECHENFSQLKDLCFNSVIFWGLCSHFTGVIMSWLIGRLFWANHFGLLLSRIVLLMVH